MNPTALMLLVLAIASEVAGTAGLKASEGFGRLGPSALALLGYALQTNSLMPLARRAPRLTESSKVRSSLHRLPIEVSREEGPALARFLCHGNCTPNPRT